MDATIDELHERVERLIPQAEWQPWPGGYPRSIERALLDSVFSMQARYSDDPAKGPFGVAWRWAQYRGTDYPDDLVQLANVDPDKLAEVLANDGKGNRGRTPKAELAHLAARRLTDLGIRTSIDFRAPSPDMITKRSAWTSVPGLGKETFEYFAMLLGEPGVKADIMIRRFVGKGDDNAVSASEARRLVKAVASRMAVNPIDLDHAIWAYQRKNT